MKTLTNRTYVLPPSSFGFLWEECRRCYYNQMVNNVRRPSAPFPSIFTKIDLAMKDRFSDGGWHSFGPAQPEFKIAYAESMISSAPITFPGRDVAIVVRGKFDSILAFRDGRTVMCDFKTSSVKPEYLAKYWVQLHAYAFALEHPAQKSLAPPRIDALGLAVFDPGSFEYDGQAGAALSGGMQWIELPRDDQRFIAFLDEVASVLEKQTPPPPSGSCQYCRYLNAA